MSRSKIRLWIMGDYENYEIRIIDIPIEYKYVNESSSTDSSSKSDSDDCNSIGYNFKCTLSYKKHLPLKKKVLYKRKDKSEVRSSHKGCQ